jgi:hypothetical protein
MLRDWKILGSDLGKETDYLTELVVVFLSHSRTISVCHLKSGYEQFQNL